MSIIGGYHCNEHEDLMPGFEIKHRTVKRTRALQPTFGLELEVAKLNGCQVEYAREFLKACGLEEETRSQVIAAKDYLMWFSRDGSVWAGGDYAGFEIVTQPCSLDYHLTKIDWKSGFAKLDEMGFTSWDSQSKVGCSCGLHCHINRAYVASNTSNPEDVLTVVFTNLADELKRFCGRKGHSGFRWCQPFDQEKFWSYKLKTSSQEAEQERISDVKGSASGDHDNRYHMVNFTNDATIEFRLMRGTTNYQTFVADLQFYYMFCEIAKRFSVEEACNVNWAYIQQFAKGLGFKEFLAVDKKRRNN